MRQHTAVIALFLLGGAFVLGLLALGLAACAEEEEAEQVKPHWSTLRKLAGALGVEPVVIRGPSRGYR